MKSLLFNFDRPKRNHPVQNRKRFSSSSPIYLVIMTTTKIMSDNDETEVGKVTLNYGQYQEGNLTLHKQKPNWVRAVL